MIDHAPSNVYSKVRKYIKVVFMQISLEFFCLFFLSYDVTMPLK